MMKASMRKLLVVMVVVATLVPAAGARAAGLKLLSSTPLDERLTELTFSSPSLADPVKVRVLLPRGAAANPGARYPALYLLHGGGGNASSWGDLDVERSTDGAPLVVVMPDADVYGRDGWYTNWPNGSQPRWEDFHVEELIPWIEAHEPVIAARSKRAIAGVSMGGFGAMSYAARHPDLFAAAASYSGALDLGTPAGIGPWLTDDLEPWGPWNGPEIRWRGHNPYDLAGNLRGVALQIYTGQGLPDGSDRIEPIIGQESRSFAARLAALGVPRDFIDYGAGGHDGALFVRDLRQSLPWLTSVLDHPADPPRVWSFRATEQEWAMRGYRLRSSRDALAWRALSNVRATGFTVTTDAATTVWTAKRYARRARYRVVARLASGKVVRDVRRADAAGRLAVKLPGSARVGITRAARGS